jgi:hypothetical protein
MTRILFTAFFSLVLNTISPAAFAIDSLSNDGTSHGAREAADYATSKAILNLNPGDEVTIRANTTTTVSCAMGSSLPDCKKAIASYESRYQTCKRSYPASTCFNNEWPAFKTRHPECLMEAFDVCVRTCGESYPGSTCYNNCR